MAKYNAENERIKHDYFDLLKEAKQQDEASIDAVAKALNRFEEYTGFKSFRRFRKEQAIAFKQYISEQLSVQTGEKLSKSTLLATCRHLRNFFEWLAMQKGYRSTIKYGHAEYFNLSANDTRIARASRFKRVPSLDEIECVIDTMPVDTAIALRNRALIAFTILTGARDAAIASLKIKHLDLGKGLLFQDAREVKTKGRKTFPTFFFPVGERIRSIVVEWVDYLRTELLFEDDGPLFPKTKSVIASGDAIGGQVLVPEHWANADSIRSIFKKAFAEAGIEYANPHSFRDTLAKLGEKYCCTAEQFKAWSQNLGHEGVLVTLYSYGEVQQERQGEIISSLSTRLDPGSKDEDLELAYEFISRIRKNRS